MVTTKRGFNLQEIPLIIMLSIQKLQWSSYVGHPAAKPVVSLVRGFYAAISIFDKKSSSATVRGKGY